MFYRFNKKGRLAYLAPIASNKLPLRAQRVSCNLHKRTSSPMERLHVVCKIQCRYLETTL